MGAGDNRGLCLLDKGGTRALLEDIRPLERIRAKPVAIISSDTKLATGSDAARKWIGTLECYTLSETDSGRLLEMDVA